MLMMCPSRHMNHLHEQHLMNLKILMKVQTTRVILILSLHSKGFRKIFLFSLIYSRMKSNDLGGDEYQENETHDAFDLLLNEEPADESLDLSNSFLENGGNSRWEHHNHNEMTASSPPSSSSFVC
jgi:hypothetical protein